MDKTEIIEHLEKITHDWLNNQKDALLLQLVGFMMDKKAQMEGEIGSGEVQKMPIFSPKQGEGETPTVNEIVEENKDDE